MAKLLLGKEVTAAMNEKLQARVAALKEKGYNTNRIRKDKVMGEAMLQKIRSGQMPSWSVLETICDLLDCQPADIIEFRRDTE